MDTIMGSLWAVLQLHVSVLGTHLRASKEGDDDGVSTLEMVIIALGLMAIAALLVTALTVAVTDRTNKIK